MTKYKLNNTIRSSSEVTLTSYMTGSTDSTSKPDEGKYQIPEFDNNQNENLKTETNRNLEIDGALNGCVLNAEKLMENLKKVECEKFGLNEFKEGSERVCLCAKFNGGCKFCPRASLPTLSLDGKASCLGCHGSSNSCNMPFNGHNTKSTKLSKLDSWRRAAGRRARSCCSTKSLTRRLPILGWLPKYTLRKALADLIAGVTVGLTVIPQAIAYAGVAGLPPQYGLYSSFMGCFVYTIFGSVKDSAIGPTAIAAILTRENLHGLGPDFAVLLAFLSGCVELLMGMLQLGFLIDFISGPVSVGFTSAAAIIIATTQLKDILGLNFPGGKFLQVWSGLYEHIGETRLWDTVLGVTCIVVLLLLRKVKDINVSSSTSESAPESSSSWRRWLQQTLWFVSTARNILVVLVSAGLAHHFAASGQEPFQLTGEVRPGLPEFSLPPFSATVGNHTYNFVEMATTLGSAVFVVPLLSILENIALAKVFSGGGGVDATQEMVALGACNVAAALCRSMPVSGALSRGAVNHASGVASPAGGLYTGALVMLALQYFTPYFYFIPKASLAAVIIAAVVFMVELHVFKPIWRTKKLDIVPAVVTFCACLGTRLELGILVGVAVNLLFLLHASARPAVTVTTHLSADGVEHAVAAVDRALVFPAAEFVRRALRKAAPPRTPLVLDASHVQATDFTAARGIKSLIEDLESRGQPLVVYNARPAVAATLQALRPRPLRLCWSRPQLDRLLKELAATE